MGFFCPNCGSDMDSVLWKNEWCTECPEGRLKESRNVTIAKGLGHKVVYLEIITGYLFGEEGFNKEPETEFIPVINEHGCIAYEDFGPDWNVKVNTVPSYDTEIECAFGLAREAEEKGLVFLNLRFDDFKNLYYCTVRDSHGVLHTKGDTTVPAAIANTYYSIFNPRRYEPRDVYVLSEEKKMSFVVTAEGSFIVDGVPETGSPTELNILQETASFEEAKKWFERVICEHPDGDEEVPF